MKIKKKFIILLSQYIDNNTEKSVNRYFVNDFAEYFYLQVSQILLL